MAEGFQGSTFPHWMVFIHCGNTSHPHAFDIPEDLSEDASYEEFVDALIRHDTFVEWYYDTITPDNNNLFVGYSAFLIRSPADLSCQYDVIGTGIRVEHGMFWVTGGHVDDKEACDLTSELMNKTITVEGDTSQY